MEEEIYRASWIRVLMLIVCIVSFSSYAWAGDVERYAVHAGSFKDVDKALGLLGDLRLEGFDCMTETHGGITSVLCGDFDNSTDAGRLKRSLIREGRRGVSLVSLVPDAGTAVGPGGMIVSVQVGSFSLRENADKVLDDLASKGEKCWSRMLGGLLKVYCGEFEKSKDTARMRKRLAALGYSGTFAISLPEWPFFVPVPVPVVPPVAVPPPPKVTPVPAKPLPVPDALIKGPPAPAPEKVAEPEPQPVVKKARKGIDASIFGRQGGHFHPFVSVTSYYSDNIYSSAEEKVADLNTVLTGGIWISAPGTKKPMLQSSSGSLPGGVQGSSFIRERDRPYQAYLLYKVDAEQYSTYDSGNFINHKVEALLGLNGAAGHRLEVSGIYLRSHDAKGEEPELELGEFTSRHMGASAVLAITNKIKVRMNLGQFMIDYDKDEFLYKEHEDLSYSGYLYFKMLPKTSVFMEYTSTMLDYDDLYDLDSTEFDYMLGVQWELTEKTTGTIKAGYSTREFDTGVRDEESAIKLVGDMSFEVGDKTTVGVNISRRRKEAGIPGADFVTNQRASAWLNSKATSKFSWTISASMAQSEYMGADQDRRDDDLSGGLKLNYQFKRWLGANMGVRRTQRTSTEAENEFSTNTIFFGLSATM
ncbi:MAG: outer membrane beta-barrel protein [Thermodesulfovibrionales bacterium]|nr:outer membrane beta-barrel protein [Thermodesulfovibrionales bacterium]